MDVCLLFFLRFFSAFSYGLSCYVFFQFFARFLTSFFDTTSELTKIMPSLVSNGFVFLPRGIIVNKSGPHSSRTNEWIRRHLFNDEVMTSLARRFISNIFATISNAPVLCKEAGICSPLNARYKTIHCGIYVCILVCICHRNRITWRIIFLIESQTVS